MSCTEAGDGTPLQNISRQEAAGNVYLLCMKDGVVGREEYFAIGIRPGAPRLPSLESICMPIKQGCVLGLSAVYEFRMLTTCLTRSLFGSRNLLPEHESAALEPRCVFSLRETKMRFQSTSGRGRAKKNMISRLVTMFSVLMPRKGVKESLRKWNISRPVP